jgi:aminoglycoside-2''-adenylyltransferase
MAGRGTRRSRSAERLVKQQLAALADVGELLDRSGFDYWLFGGWAVDFHLGTVTREHEDIDLAVWLQDAEAVASLLYAAAWQHKPLPGEDGGTGYERGRVRVELTYLACDETGRIFIPFRDENALWSGEPLGNEVRELLCVRARVIPLALLRAGKSSPRHDHDEAAKDRADFEALSRLRS